MLDGRFNKFHDEVKFAIARSLETLGVGYSSEVHGVFTPVIPPAMQADARRFMQGRGDGARGQRQGLVPDFKVELERLVDGASTTAALAELKMLHAGRSALNPIGGTTYKTRGNGAHCVLTGDPNALRMLGRADRRDRVAKINRTRGPRTSRR